MSASDPEHIEDVTRIPLIEEEAQISVQQRLAAKVRVTARTELDEEWVRADLRHSSVDIKTVPIGREIDAPPEVRVEGNTTIIPVFEEIIVVEKRLFLKEELHVTRHSVVEAIEEPILLRKQRVSVERIEENKETNT